MALWASLPAGAAGAVVGSFVSVCALRYAEGRSPIRGRSACDGCRRPLSFLETVPLMSFVALRGRCSTCGEGISPSHPTSELAGAAGFAAIVALLPVGAWAGAGVLLCLLLFISIFDARTLRIPDAATALVAVVGLHAAWIRQDFVSSILAGAVLFAVLNAVRAWHERTRGRQGLGLGDVKLLAALTPWTGATLAPLALTGAAALAMLWVVARRNRPTDRLPFGPFISATFWIIGMVVRAS